VPPLKHHSISSSARSLSDLVHSVDSGDLDLSPPYQRGDVWTDAQRANLIKSILIGIPIAAIVLNRRGDNRAWEQRTGRLKMSEPYFACIDGKQRLTTVGLWLNDGLWVPGEWFDGVYGAAVVTYQMLPVVTQRFFLNRAVIPVAEATLGSVEEEAEVYDLINSAGTAHTRADLDRARALRA
jgi:hypothetical protein